MITTNVLQRTFRIKTRLYTGTAFAIDLDGRQYLVTARHLVEGYTSGDLLQIFHGKRWKHVPIDLVGLGEGEIDVAVFACGLQLAPTYELEPTARGLVIGQVVYFLGFPFGWDGGAEEINRDFPLPFAKSGVLSALTFQDPRRIFVDGHNNSGFSGGPLVFKENEDRNSDLRVAGVVSNYPTPLEPIVNIDGDPILNDEEKPIAYVRENPGITVAVNIRHATDLIKGNPIGFLLPEEGSA